MIDLILSVLKFIARGFGLMGGNSGNTGLPLPPKPKNRRGKDQLDALKVENEMLRADAATDDSKRTGEIADEIENTDENGLPSVNFDNHRGK